MLNRCVFIKNSFPLLVPFLFISLAVAQTKGLVRVQVNKVVQPVIQIDTKSTVEKIFNWRLVIFAAWIERKAP
jgi:hypothetical protein